MEMHDPSSQTTLLIILGASDWPLSPGFSRSEAFVYAAGGLKKYFLDHDQFGIAPENVLDLFNVNDSPDDLDKQISRFLERRIAAMKADGNAARDLICYFVGHGGFEGRDSALYLAVRRTRMENLYASGIPMASLGTRMENLYASGIPMASLAKTLTEKARPLRRIIILDCCFAAAAFSAFQAGDAGVALKKTIDAFEVREKNRVFPLKGTALLCSSDHAIPSRILPDDSSTMFTNALLNVLAKGTSSQQKYLSLREVTELASDFLSETENAPMPALHSPDQREGDIADMPFFPNPCAQEKQAAQKEQQSTSVRTPPFSQSKFWYRMSRSRAVLLLSVLIVILVSFSLIGVTKAPRSPVNTMPPPSSREHPTLTSTYQPTSTPTIGQHPTITSDTKSNSSPTSTTISSQMCWPKNEA